MKNHAGIVLGAGKELGRTISHRLSSTFKCLILAGRTREDLETTMDELKSLEENQDVDFLIKQIDLMDYDSLVTFVESSKKVGIPIKALINTAAGFYKGRFYHQPLDSINKLISANYTGPVLLTSKLLQDNLRGKVIDIIHMTNINSSTTLDSSRSSSMHTSSKAALNIFSRVLGREDVNDRVRLTILAPWTYARNSHEGLSKESIAQIVEFLLSLPNDAWIESIEVRPTFFNPKANNE